MTDVVSSHLLIDESKKNMPNVKSHKNFLTV